VAESDFSVAELARGLDRASDDIKREVGQLVEQAAQNTQARVQAVYPVGPTGNLRKLVRVSNPRGFSSTAGGSVIPAKVVRATAPHVHIWQEGTRDRFDATRANARRGRSPRHGDVMASTAIRERADMLRKAQAVLDRKREL
jgi:hypothetical protein